MEAHPEGHTVDIYGDGSYTSPTVWWPALGGFGIWVPDWNKREERSEDRETTSYHGAATGQRGNVHQARANDMGPSVGHTVQKHVRNGQC